MSRWVIALACLALAMGCQKPEPQVPAGPLPKNSTKPPPAMVRTDETPDETPAEKPKPTPPAPKGPVDEKAKPAKPPAKALAHPNRLYQLSDLRTTEVNVNGHDLNVWIMETPSKITEGMMWLTDKDVRDDQGMIFAFPSEEPRSFWMQNTLIPLDIIYISSDRKVVSIAHGKPRDESPLPSARPAQFVLELKAGVAKRLGIKPGDFVNMSPAVKAAE